jgi:hypothetical protein
MNASGKLPGTLSSYTDGYNAIRSESISQIADQTGVDYRFWILDFGFGIGGIASLYPLINQIEYLKSKIRILKSKIFIET